MTLVRLVVLGLAGLLGLSSVATLARVCLFYSQFGSFWPAMFCYRPEGAFMFESILGLPVLPAVAASALTLVYRRERPVSSVALSICACGLGVFLLYRVWRLVDELTGHQYDEGCGRITAWAYQYPLLNLATRPISAVALVGTVGVAVGLVMYNAARTRVA